ncbi:MAG: hypothetical protein H7Z14_13465 [Anaerolineae bacterium]|nr:hypothetical protein [Phycisphaerae bacterium]
MPVQSDISPIAAPIDEELAAREANVRRWWRRAIGLSVFVIVVSPLCALLIWRIHLVELRRENASFPPNAAGPPDRLIKTWHQEYMRSEGHGRRGTQFFSLLSWIDQRRANNTRTCSEEELLYYCGPPDTTFPGQGNSKNYVYYYAQARSRDSVAICTLSAPVDQPLMLSQIGYTTAAAFESSRAKPTTTATTKPAE